MRLTLNPVHHQAESEAKVLAALRHPGNDVGPTHALALRQLMEGMANHPLGIAPGHFAWVDIPSNDNASCPTAAPRAGIRYP